MIYRPFGTMELDLVPKGRYVHSPGCKSGVHCIFYFDESRRDGIKTASKKVPIPTTDPFSRKQPKTAYIRHFRKIIQKSEDFYILLEPFGPDRCST